MKILFLHGWQSTPGGIKPSYLKDHGHEVLNPALPDDDFDAAVRIVQAEFDQHHPDAVVGSSRGGAVAMNIKIDVPLVLLCPAWKRWGTATTVKPGTLILHSQADDVIPFTDSQELLRNSGLPESALIVVGNEHRLANPDSLGKMLEAVEKVRTIGGDVVRHEAGVPRQFGIGILLVITTMFAVLFAMLQGLGAPPLAFAGIAVFFGAVGLGQMLLFKGKRPRRASVIVGACFLPCLLLGTIVIEMFEERRVVPDFFTGLLLFLIWSPVGALFGYLAGLLIAGVFLVIDMLKKRLGGSKGTDQADEAST
jgi:hypothetical protein